MVVLQRLSSPRPPLDQALQRALTLAAQSVRAGADFDRSGKTALANAAIERGGVEGTCAAKEFAGGLRSKSSGAFCVSISVASFATRKRHLALHCALIHANKEGDYLSLALRLLRQSVVAWRTVDGLTPNFLAISSAVVARPLRVADKEALCTGANNSFIRSPRRRSQDDRVCAGKADWTQALHRVRSRLVSERTAASLRF